jgi:hypothetical protein
VGYATEHRDRRARAGEFSQTWQYRSGRLMATVSLDYPFSGWHELSECYAMQGWDVNHRQKIVSDDGFKCVQVQLSRPSGPKAHLLFTLMDERGQTIRSKDTFTWEQGMWERLRARIKPSFAGVSWGSKPAWIEDRLPTYQVQVFIASDAVLGLSEREATLGFLKQAVSLLPKPMAAGQAAEAKG